MWSTLLWEGLFLLGDAIECLSARAMLADPLAEVIARDSPIHCLVFLSCWGGLPSIIDERCPTRSMMSA